MLGQDRDAQDTSDPQTDALELNKETLDDLDVELPDADGIRGGGITGIPTTAWSNTSDVSNLSDKKTKN